MRIVLCTWQSSVPTLSCRFLHFWKKVTGNNFRVNGPGCYIAWNQFWQFWNLAKTKKMQDLYWNIKPLPIPQRRGRGGGGAIVLEALAYGGFPSARQRWSHCSISSRLCLSSLVSTGLFPPDSVSIVWLAQLDGGPRQPTALSQYSQEESESEVTQSCPMPVTPWTVAY